MIWIPTCSDMFKSTIKICFYSVISKMVSILQLFTWRKNLSELSKLVIIVFFVYVIHINYTLSHNFILL